MTMTGRERLVLAPEVLSQEVEGELILLDTRQAQYYALDAVGTRCWELLAHHGNEEQVIDSILEEYEVDEDTVRSDVAELVRRLVERRLVVEIPLTSKERNAE